MYNLADLTRLSGAKRRTVQLWAEGGALIAEPLSDRQGSGVHRAFSRDEAIICMVLSRIAEWNLSIGRLRSIAQGLRVELKKTGQTRELIGATIYGHATARLAVHANGEVDLIEGRTEENLPRLLTLLGERNESVIIVFLDKALGVLRSEQ